MSFWCTEPLWSNLNVSNDATSPLQIPKTDSTNMTQPSRWLWGGRVELGFLTMAEPLRLRVLDWVMTQQKSPQDPQLLGPCVIIGAGFRVLLDARVIWCASQVSDTCFWAFRAIWLRRSVNRCSALTAHSTDHNLICWLTPLLWAICQCLLLFFCFMHVSSVVHFSLCRVSAGFHISYMLNQKYVGGMDTGSMGAEGL